MTQLGAQVGASAGAQLEHALALDAQGQGDAANRILAELSDAPESRAELGLQLVEAWWRVSHSERAINTLSKWRQEAPRSPDPLLRARARALTGSPFDADAFWKELDGVDGAESPRCRLLPLAQSLDVVGQRDVGQALLERSWADARCQGGEAERALWERPRAPELQGAVPRPVVVTRYVLGPGLESKVVRIMPEQSGELPEGVGLIDLSIPEDAVEARYGLLDSSAKGCDEAPLCVSLHHPSVAQPGDRLVGQFALRTGGKRAYDPEGLLDGITSRIKAQGAWDPWRRVSAPVSRQETPRSLAPPEATVKDTPVREKDAEDEGMPWGWLTLFGVLVVVVIARARVTQAPTGAP